MEKLDSRKLARNFHYILFHLLGITISNLEVKQLQIQTYDQCSLAQVYSEQEANLLFRGDVTAKINKCKHVKLGACDLVILPPDISCTWKINTAIHEQYYCGNQKINEALKEKGYSNLLGLIKSISFVYRTIYQILNIRPSIE